jgi:acyl transferase domain-containing protein
VGMGFRFPGRADSPEQLREVIAAGADATGLLPADRGWDAGEMQQGGFVRDAAGLDAGFFQISLRC